MQRSSCSDCSAKHAGNTHWQPVLQWQTLWSAANMGALMGVAHSSKASKSMNMIVCSYCQSNSKIMCFKTCHVATFYNGMCKSIYLYLLNQAAQDPIVHDQKHQSNHTAPTTTAHECNEPGRIILLRLPETNDMLDHFRHWSKSNASGPCCHDTHV